jgi:hypothetical protein
MSGTPPRICGVQWSKANDAKPPAFLLRQADLLGLPAASPLRRDCRALSLWIAEQPKQEPVAAGWSLDRIGEEMERLSRT